MNEYSKEIGDKICHAIATGQSLRSVCREIGIEKSIIIEWLENPALKEFIEQYASARRIAENMQGSAKANKTAASRWMSVWMDVLYDKGWFMYMYMVSSIILAITSAVHTEWAVAFYIIVGSFLSLFAGGYLKSCLWWSEKIQQVVMLIAAVVAMALAQWLSNDFSLHLFGYDVSGASWSWIGFAIGFVCTDKKIAGINARNKPSQNFMGAFEYLTKIFQAFIDKKHPIIKKFSSEPVRLALNVSSLKMAYMTIMLVLIKQHHDFMISDECKTFKIMALEKMSIQIQKILILMEHIPTDELNIKSMAKAVNEYEKCDLAIQQTIRNFSDDSPFPVDPVFSLINEQIPLATSNGSFDVTPAQRDKVYKTVFQEMAMNCKKYDL